MTTDHNPWPPEGTRVRIVGTQETGKIYPLAGAHLVVTDDRAEFRRVVERHEIEVIDAVPKD